MTLDTWFQMGHGLRSPGWQSWFRWMTDSGFSYSKTLYVSPLCQWFPTRGTRGTRAHCRGYVETFNNNLFLKWWINILNHFILSPSIKWYVWVTTSFPGETITCGTRQRTCRKMGKWLKHPVALDSGEGSEGTAEKGKKEANPKPRKYSGFTSTPADPPQPQCFFCGEVLANSAMKPSHLQQHQSTKHLGSVSKTEEFFKWKVRSDCHKCFKQSTAGVWRCISARG